MITKAFEVRDRHTFAPVIAIQMIAVDSPRLGETDRELSARLEPERYLMARTGYGHLPKGDVVVLVRMECAGKDRNASYDPYAWGDRTFAVAHDYITKHFDELESGAVIDVEFILGETKEPKQSERVS